MHAGILQLVRQRQRGHEQVIGFTVMLSMQVLIISLVAAAKYLTKGYAKEETGLILVHGS